MTQIAVTFSSDQAEAYDQVTQVLKGAGVDIEDGMLYPPRDANRQLWH